MMMSFTLIEDLCARLCHDLGGPLGGVSAALDLIEGDGTEDAVAVAREGSAALRQRIRLWRTAVGGGAEAMGGAGLAEVLEGSLGGGRVTVDVSGLGGMVLPDELARATLVGAMIAGEALPRGGVVRIAGVQGGAAILPEGRNAAWPVALTAALAGEPVTGSRNVLAPLLVAICGRGKVRPALAFGSGGGAAPLILSAG